MSIKRGEQLMITNITVEKLVDVKHPYRNIKKRWNIRALVLKYEDLYSKNGRPAFPLEKGFAMLFLQTMEDLSDRQMEQALKDNNSMKWFCGFELLDETPDHSYFGRLRERLGTENVAKIFNSILEHLKKQGLCGNIFTFVDSTAIVSKVATWEERDKAIKDGLDKLDNSNVSNYSSDKNAKYGCKGKKKFWFGFKRHHAVDMKSGFIKKVVVTPANVPDGNVLKSLCPKDGGMIFADKAYSGKKTRQDIKGKGCYDGGVIYKDNQKEKNKDKDRWTTKVRMPFENVFSKMCRRTKYNGLVKTQYQAFMEAIVHNIKRSVKIMDLCDKQGIGVSSCLESL